MKAAIRAIKNRIKNDHLKIGSVGVRDLLLKNFSDLSAPKMNRTGEEKIVYRLEIIRDIYGKAKVIYKQTRPEDSNRTRHYKYEKKITIPCRTTDSLYVTNEKFLDIDPYYTCVEDDDVAFNIYKTKDIVQLIEKELKQWGKNNNLK